jgi:hypothetical protein
MERSSNLGTSWADVAQSLAPASVGMTETFSVTGLSSGTLYCFRIAAKDEVQNVGVVSDTACARTLATAPEITIHEAGWVLSRVISPGWAPASAALITGSICS